MQHGMYRRLAELHLAGGRAVHAGLGVHLTTQLGPLVRNSSAVQRSQLNRSVRLLTECHPSSFELFKLGLRVTGRLQTNAVD